MSTDLSGGSGHNAGSSAISGDGNFVAFSDDSANMVPDDTNNTFDIFLTATASDGTCAKPQISLSKSRVYWGSYSEYLSHRLSIDYAIDNKGSGAAYSVRITQVTPTAGVSNSTYPPFSLGTIPAGSSGATTIKFNIPSGVTSFVTTLHAVALDSCGTVYTYP